MTCSLRSVSHSSKIMEPKQGVTTWACDWHVELEGVWELPVCGRLVEAQVSWTCVWVGVGDCLAGLSPWPVGLPPSQNRIEISDPAGARRSLVWGQPPPPPPPPRCHRSQSGVRSRLPAPCNAGVTVVRAPRFCLPGNQRPSPPRLKGSLPARAASGSGFLLPALGGQPCALLAFVVPAGERGHRGVSYGGYCLPPLATLRICSLH